MTSDLLRVSRPNKQSSAIHWTSVLALLVAIAALVIALSKDRQATEESAIEEPVTASVEQAEEESPLEEGGTEGLALAGYAPVDQDDLLRWHGLRGFRLQVSTSGQQDALGTRFAFYKRGELVSATEWHWDLSPVGQQKTQELSLLFQIDEDARVVRIWRRLQGAAGSLQLALPESFQAQLFPVAPRLVNGHQIPLAVNLAPDETWAINQDFNPDSSYLILVMELMEYITPVAEEE